MATFDTPEPITATIEVAVGDVRVSAGDHDTTVVDVRPGDWKGATWCGTTDPGTNGSGS